VATIGDDGQHNRRLVEVPRRIRTARGDGIVTDEDKGNAAGLNCPLQYRLTVTVKVRLCR
jgi:hypothetical protein